MTPSPLSSPSKLHVSFSPPFPVILSLGSFFCPN
nr:MAG TPA: hypothetical protein [Bacteriophage sp.]